MALKKKKKKKKKKMSKKSNYCVSMKKSNSIKTIFL